MVRREAVSPQTAVWGYGVHWTVGRAGGEFPRATSSQVKKLSPGSYPGPSLRGKFFWLTEANINSAITRDGSRCESRRLGPVLVIATQPGQRRHQLQHLDVQLLGQCLDHHLQQRRRQMSKLDFVKRRKLSSCTFLVPSVRFELTLDGF
jgi:hypothetical protein